MEAYANSFGLDPARGSVVGHPILVWNGNQCLHTEGALLAGEAACLVDPFTAEGIRPALLSGVRAAEAIDRWLGGDRRALRWYTDTLRLEHGIDMAWASRLCRVFYSLAPLSYHLLIKRPAMVKMLTDVACGNLRYRDVGRELLRAIGPFAPSGSEKVVSGRLL